MSKIPLKYLPIAGICILLIIVGILIKTGFNGDGTTVPDKVLPAVPYTAKNFHTTEDDLIKKRRFILYAEEGIYSEDTRLVSIKNFQLKIEPLDNNPDVRPIEITGKKGFYNQKTREVVGEEGIEGHTQDGYGIYTEYITYNDTDGIVKTDKPVKISSPFYTVSGSEGFLFDTEKDQIEIYGHVTTTLKKGFFD